MRKLLLILMILIFAPGLVSAEWKPVERNFEKVKHSKLRKKIDHKFNKVHDELSDCYYNYWKQGKSKKFQEYDKQATPELSKELFDKLHGLIWHKYNVNFHGENLKQEDKIDESEYNKIAVRDENGNIISYDKRDEKSLEKVNNYKLEGLEITIE